MKSLEKVDSASRFADNAGTETSASTESLFMSRISPLRAVHSLGGILAAWAFFLSCSLLQMETLSGSDNSSLSRVADGLVLHYDFSEARGTRIHDRASSSAPLDLEIKNPQRVSWGSDGLTVRSGAIIHSAVPASKLFEACRRSGEVSLEAWIDPANGKQSGPARIVSFSKDTSRRNLTLGQSEQEIEVRLRTTESSDNGLPSVASGSLSLAPKLTHVVFTRQRDGQARIYLDGELASEKSLPGLLRAWDPAYRLALSDEFAPGGKSGGRAWEGTFYLLAAYRRSLSADEVQRNFRAGPRASIPDSSFQSQDTFAEFIAPLLSEHCIECHDALNHKGGLDLSHRAAAFAGGESGQSIVPGDAHRSSLIEAIQSDYMPLDREPLTESQKEQLITWVNSGADWTLEFVDPALFVHGHAHSQQWVQRLTVDEYVSTVRTTLGVDIAEEAVRLLPKDVRADGFANTSYNLGVDLKHIEVYAALAEKIVDQIDVLEFASRFSKRPKFTDKDMGTLIEGMGRWVLRGPLEKDEVIAYRGISTSVAAVGGDYETAVRLILESMLQSPRFLYRVENQLGDGEVWPVDEYELANRLSYILWGSSPDPELFEAAERRLLFDAQELDRQIDRMLDDPRTGDRARQFVRQWLNLDALQNLNPNPNRFPDWNAGLGEAMRLETLAFFERVALQENRPLGDLLTAQVTFVTPELARHYRLQAKPKTDGSNRLRSTDSTGQWTPPQGLIEMDLSSDPARGGLLTQGSLLTIGGDNASMVTRGLFVLHDLLRGVIKDPPPCVDATPVPSKPGVSQRMIATSRIENQACGGCHAKFEPLAFGLEKFDGLGAFHERDHHGNDLRDDGQIVFPGEGQAVRYESIAELMRLLAESERVQHSLTWKLVQFALGRPLSAGDASDVKAIHERAMEGGGSYRSTMRAVVKSDLVRLTGTQRMAALKP